MRRRIVGSVALSALLATSLVSVASVSAQGVSSSVRCPWVGSTAPVATRVAQVLAAMSLSQKISLLHGQYGSSYAGLTPAIPALCVPALNFQDGPAGVGDGLTGVTQLPAPVVAAATWDSAAQRQYGSVLGAEQAGKGTTVTLAPTVNLVRDPRWGRAFESTGEDPFLAGQVGTSIIKGIQGQGQLAQVKHLAVYNQETNRNTPADNAQVSTRALQELYLPAFAAAVKSGAVASVMCSYSTVNGTPACQNSYLQNTVLREQFGFDGFITSDWDATKTTVASATGGLDIEMPGDTYFGATLTAAVGNGRVSVAVINSMVSHILTQMFGFGLFDKAPTGSPTSVVTTDSNIAVARSVAAQGTVLLKNTHNALPITAATHSVAVIGQDAADHPQYTGGGSASVTSTYAVAPLLGIQRRAPAGTAVTFDPGQSPASAAAVAAEADVAVVFASDFETEASDLNSIDLPGTMNAVISAVSAVNKNTVVVLNTGSPVTMPWLPTVAGVLEAWYPGQEDGTAIAQILFGDVNPSGHLPVTFPRSLADVPAHTASQWPGTNGTVQYSEGLDVGYRWYDQKNISPLFPFGFGLSYTTFAYSNLSIGAVNAGGTATVSATVTNTGTRSGADVVQLYVTDPAAAGEPPEQLKGYQKVSLAPGASARVSIAISLHDLATWSTHANAWTTTTGGYGIAIGDSSRTLPLRGTLAVFSPTPARTVTVADPGPIDITAGVHTDQTLHATDSANAPVTFTADSLPAGLTLTAAGTISGTPTGTGTTTTTVTATDRAGARGTTTFVMTVNPADGAGGALGQITGLTGLCADVRADSDTDGTAVQTYPCDGTNAQQWAVRADHTVRALGHCLDVTAAGTATGTPVQLYACNGTAAQQWAYQASGALVNVGSGLCLDVPSASTAPGAQLQLYTCNGTAAQQWVLPT